MIIFLYGQDTFRSHQKLNEIVEYYKKIHKSGLSLKYFTGNELNFQKFEEIINQRLMFKENKLLVLIDSFLNSEFKKKFLEKAKKNTKIYSEAENIILFYDTSQISERDSLFSFLRKSAKCQEFASLEGYKLKNWTKKEFEKFGWKVEDKVVDKLIDFVGDDLWQMENEIQKLVNYKSKDKEISSNDVELLVLPHIETDIFKTIDAIASKDKKKTFQLLKKHLEKGDSPLYLLSMINFQFRNLLIIKDLLERNQSPYNSSLHPFIVKKSLNLLRRFGISELKRIYQKMFKVDFTVKTGKTDPETALDLLITEI